MIRQVGRALAGGIVILALAGCEAWLVTETVPPSFPSGATLTEVPPVADLPTSAPPTVTPTITLTPRFSPTPPIGPTSTLADPELTGTALGPVGATRPVIEYFVAFPEEIDPGEPILLFWKTSGAISGAIYRLNLDGTPGRTWEVKLEGDLSVLPVLLGRTETYVLSITNGVTTVQQAAEVKVNCLTPWFFDPPPPEGCPQPEVFTSEAVAQEFEHGRMFWLQATGDILVLFDVSLDEFDDEATPTPQGTPVIEEDLPPAWLIFDDPWLEGMPEDDPEIQPPEGFRQPRRGFELVWRDNPEVRERLGWAVGEEVPFTMQWQFERLPGGDWRYFNDAAGGIIILEPDGVTWRRLGF